MPWSSKTRRRRPVLWRPLLLLLAGGLFRGFLPLPAFGAEEVIFLDGRTLRVEGHRVQEDRVTLELEGGGRITVPRSRIRAIRTGRGREEPLEPPLGGSGPPGVNEAADPVESPPGGLGDPDEPDLFSSIAEIALKYGLDTQLVAAVALVESGLDPEAVSPKGARGLMQLMPRTAARHGVRDPFDPVENLEAGISHLKELLDRFHGDLEVSLAAYNAGEAAVERYGGIPPYPETVRFVHRVLALARAR